MDYSRIYREFITNRRILEPSIEGYYEVHHITPRCLGGTDKQSNLIRLVAQDHYFAHKLLAQIHGGRLISILGLMAKSAARRRLGRVSTPTTRKRERKESVLRLVLSSLKLTQARLAGLLGVDTDTVGRWSNGSVRLPGYAVQYLRALLICKEILEGAQCGAREARDALCP